MKVKNVSSKFIGALSIVALFVFLVGPQFANAAATSLTAASDTMSREQTSAYSLHTIKFTATSGLSSGQTITIVFPSSTFTTTGLVITDLQICHDGQGTATVTGGTACTASGETISSSNGANTQWGATVTISGTTTIVLTAPSSWSTPVSAGHVITVEIAAAHMQNPSSVSTPQITIATSADTLGDNVTVPIIAGDQVSLTASVAETISFSINASTNNSGSTYAIPLGTLSTASVTGSNGTLASIWANLSTNAGGGAIVTIASANGDLKSTSTSDNIPSANGTMTAGIANYGVCVMSVSHVGGAVLAKGTNFTGSPCGHTPAGNVVTALTVAPQTILTAATPIDTGVSEIVLDAAISTTTPAHSDYADTLTFIATGTF